MFALAILRLLRLSSVVLVLIASGVNAGTLSGKVKDRTSAPIADVAVTLIDTSTTLPVDSSVTDVNGDYSVSVADGVYHVHVTPPVASGLADATIEGVLVSGNTNLDIVLVLAEAVTLSGVLRDRDGTPIPNQLVSFGTTSMITGLDGSYALMVTPGTYGPKVRSDGDPGPVSLPELFSISGSSFELTADSVQDMTLENVLLHVTVQDTLGNPVPNTTLTLPFGLYTMDFELFPGLSTVSGFMGHSTQTDSSGMATLPLFSTPDAISINAGPPSGIGLGGTTVTVASAMSDTMITIVLEGAVTLSGVLRDRDGTPIPNQLVSFGTTSMITGLDGSYALMVTPGTYGPKVRSDGDPGPVSLPELFNISGSSFELTADSVQDMTLENVLLHVTVQDTLGNPVPNTTLTLPFGLYTMDFELIPGLSTVSGFMGHITQTDSSGMATLPLFSTPDAISINVGPPSESGFLLFTVDDIDASQDANLAIILITQVPVTVAITDFKAEANNAGVTLQWTVFADEEFDGFRVYRSEGKSLEVPIGQKLSPHTRTFTDDSVQPAKTYTYTLVAMLLNGSVVQSAPVTVSTPRIATRLIGNFPNPFNPRTTIRFSLSIGATVYMDLFDVKGRLVATLSDHAFPAGTSEVKWDGRDNSGQPAASGVYFVRFNAAGVIETRKIVLIK